MSARDLTLAQRSAVARMVRKFAAWAKSDPAPAMLAFSHAMHSLGLTVAEASEVFRRAQHNVPVNLSLDAEGEPVTPDALRRELANQPGRKARFDAEGRWWWN
jgi:hypothetical protein